MISREHTFDSLNCPDCGAKLDFRASWMDQPRPADLAAVRQIALAAHKKMDCNKPKREGEKHRE